MSAFEVLASDRRTFTIEARDGLHACERVADLHAVAVTAWREVRHGLFIGAPDPRTSD